LDYVFELRRLSTNVPVVFTSQPIIGTSTGSVYTYNISAVDPDDGPITFAATTKPAWLTLVDNGNGTARLSGTPGVAGDFNVELTATSGSSTPVAQSFTIHVENSEVYALKAYSRESDISNPLLSVPRIYIVNSGDAPISGVRYEYYFSTEPDAVGITVDHYYLPNASATFSKISDCFHKLTITPSIPIQPGQVFPSVDGSATGIHYSNWSPFIKDNDYSNNMSSTFKENIRICIYNASNELIWGMPPSVSNVPPVADAGSDISKIDNEGDGEIISFDGAGSYDIDGSVIKYEWMEGGTVLQIGRKAKIKLLKGIHTIVLRVTDNKGLISTDNIMVVISEPGTSTKFTLTPSAIPANTPVTLSYTLPASLNGATVRCLLQREWGILPWNLLGTAGTHNLTIWDWNKYFFGGSGPWNVKFEINGSIVDSKVITFSY
jgi:hypothetical protein